MTKTRIEPSDTVLLFADLQAGIADLPLTVRSERLRIGVSALARLAKIFGIPTVVTVVKSPDGGAVKILPELKEALGEVEVCLRMTADSLRDEHIAAIIEKSGRKTLLISGVATELAVQLPALTGSDLGYRVFVVVDACGGMSARTEQAALDRIRAAGGNFVSVMTLAGELTGNLGSPEAQKSVPLIFEIAAAG